MHHKNKWNPDAGYPSCILCAIQAPQATSQQKGTKGQQQGKGGKQQKGSKKQDKQKQQQKQQQPQLPQQQKAGPQPSGGKGDKKMASKDEKPSVAGSDGSEQPQKTKAELKAERRAIQVIIHYSHFAVIFSCVCEHLSL